MQSRPPGYSPPVVQPRRQRGPGSSGPTSRFTTPARNVQEGNRLQTVMDDASYFRASSSGAGGMDVDDENTSLIFERAIRSETVFAKNQQMAVSFYSHLPAEVKQVLKNAGQIFALFSLNIQIQFPDRLTFLWGFKTFIGILIPGMLIL
jgi:hypothetical protein